MRPTIFALLITLSLFTSTASASTLLTQPLQNQQALLYYGGQTNQVNFGQGAVLGTITTLRLWLQSTTTRTVYLGWQSADGNAGNYATGTVSGGNTWQWVDFDLTWNSSYNAPIATSTRIFSTTTAQFSYYIPSFQSAPDVLAGCMQATSSLVYFMGGFYAPQCGTPTFELLGESTSSPATTSVPCVTECYSNVLFLPGLQASRLYRHYTNCLNGCERMLWTPDGSPYFEDLHLTISGTSVWDDIYTRDVVDEVIGFNIYKSFLADLKHWKNDEGLIDDYAAIPYDWRLSLDSLIDGGYKNTDGTLSYLKATSTPYIIQELERLARKSRTEKVTIIAHSNGGLVAKALMIQLEALGKADLVDNVVFVASPQTGTPQALGAILHGYNQALPIEWFPAMLSKSKARTMALNMPGAYHLLPSEQYFRDVQTPVVSFANSSPLLTDAYSRYGLMNSWTEMNDFVLGNETAGGRTSPEADDLNTPIVGNVSLLQYARDIHRTLDAWTPPSGVHVFQIAGWGVDTLATIQYGQKKKGGVFQWKEDFTMTEDGDGTVVIPSAHAMNASSSVERWWVNLGKYNILSPDFLSTKHADILEVNELRKFIKENILQRSTTIIPEFISNTRPTTSSTDKRLRYFLHSPLSLELYDDEGHHVGYSTTTGMLEEQIHGAYYGEFGEVKYISVPASTTLHVVMDGYATDMFTLNIEEVIGDTIIATTTFADIPSSTSTIVTMDFTDGTIGNASPLHIDANGDGAIEYSLTAVLGGEVTLPAPKLPLTVTALNKTITLGAPIPLFTATLSGFQNGDTATSSVTGSPSCTTTATTASVVGVYPVTCTIGTLTSPKYDFTTFAPGTLTILYKWSGFLQPINDTVYNPTQSLSVFKGGSTVPVKFQLKNASGTLVQSASSPIWLTPQKLSPMSALIDESMYSDPTTSGLTFRWDSVSQQYVYNWSTKGLITGYWYRIYVKLEDGTMQSVVVGIR